MSLATKTPKKLDLDPRLTTIASTPIDLEAMLPYLKLYPSEDAHIIEEGFRHGFILYFEGPLSTYIVKNHRSAREHIDILLAKVNKDIALGRIVGPFDEPPLPFLRCSAVGLVPKKSDNPDPMSPDNWRFIHDLSTFPRDDSVNSWIPEEYSTVKYATLDSVIDQLSGLGKSALMAKSDLKSAFSTLPMAVSCFNLLGFTINGKYYINCTMPMGASCSCASYERYSTFLQWCVQYETGIDTLSHYLDDYIFFSSKDSPNCQLLLDTFHEICQKFGVPVSPEKIVNPTTKLEFLGLTLCTDTQQVQVPETKLVEVREKIKKALAHERSRITLKELQSLIGSLNFLCKAIAPGRPFVRRLSFLTRGLTQPWQHVRLNKGVKDDLHMWLTFLEKYNGVTFFRDIQWSDTSQLGLYSDASMWGFGIYFNGRWAFSEWPCQSRLTTSIQIMEMFPIAVAMTIWGHFFQNKKVIFHCDNMSVVEALNKKSSKCGIIMSILRFITLKSLEYNMLFKATHVMGVSNVYCDQLSRGQVQAFRESCPRAYPEPDVIPPTVWLI